MLKTKIENDNQTTILSLDGKFDIAEHRNFENIFKEQLLTENETIALNLENLSYIDSSGIGSLVKCLNLAKRRGIKFLCYSIPNEIEDVFKLSKIDNYIDIIPSKDY